MAKLLATLLIGGAGAVAAIVLVGSNDDEGSVVPAVPAEAQDAYFVGSRLGGFALTEILVPPEGAGDSTSFIYGDCEPSGDAGCAPPLEIQTWDICDRFPDGSSSAALVDLRGAKGEYAPDEGRAEVYTGSKAAVIFSDPELSERAVDELRPVGAQQRSSTLAPPNTRAC
jgi:hypothetical protein